MAVTFTGGVNSPIVIGNDAVTQNLFCIENGIASRVNVIVRSFEIDPDYTVALAAVSPIVKVCRATAISGGVTLAKQTFTSTQTSDSAVVFRSAMLEGAPITATAGDTVWQQFLTRAHTAVEQIAAHAPIESTALLPDLVITKDFVLRPGQSLLARITAAATTSNAARTNNFHAHVAWEEDAIATYAISGTVTLSGSPVSGAIVTVIEADDASMTNAVLRETIVTLAGGTWSSNIRTGKTAAAFVQYENGGTYYTAPGSPYLS